MKPASAGGIHLDRQDIRDRGVEIAGRGTDLATQHEERSASPDEGGSVILLAQFPSLDELLHPANLFTGKIGRNDVTEDHQVIGEHLFRLGGKPPQVAGRSSGQILVPLSHEKTDVQPGVAQENPPQVAVFPAGHALDV